MRSADRHQHELLKVDRVVGVDAAIEDVQERHRQQIGVLAAEIAPQRLVVLDRLGAGRSQGHSKHRVRAQPALTRGVVEVDECTVKAGLVAGVAAANGRRDLAVDVVESVLDALAAEAAAAIAKLDGLLFPGRGARGEGRAAACTRRQRDVHLDRRVAAAVKNLAAADVIDYTHRRPPSMPSGASRI
jgi:hypothetical protein